MKVTQMPPVHAANLVANSGNTAYGVDVIGLYGNIDVLAQDCNKSSICCQQWTGLILGLRSANERRRYFVTTSLIGWAQTLNHP